MVKERKSVTIAEQKCRDPSWPLTIDVRDGHLVITEKGDAEIDEPDIMITLRVGIDGMFRRVESVTSEK